MTARIATLLGALALAVVVGVAGCTVRGTGELSSSGAVVSPTRTVVVYAAASLGDVFDRIAAEFTRSNPDIDVEFSLGGSSALAEQLRQGAPGDVFAAASEQAMAPVSDAGLTPEGVHVFATNTLELAVPPGNPGRVTGLSDLARPELAIALCASDVPCGAASAVLLSRAGVTAQPDTLEQDVRAALTKVTLGEVDAALVYRTDVRQAGASVEGIEVAGANEVVNRYPIAELRDAGDRSAARAFVTFVRSSRAAAILEEAGFGPA